MSDNKKNIAVLLGDPSGIGPELIVKLLDNKICNDSNIVVIGEKNFRRWRKNSREKNKFKIC
jgi:4-hydroxythreonine-4-phosphate dehydrogenase